MKYFTLFLSKHLTEYMGIHFFEKMVLEKGGTCVTCENQFIQKERRSIQEDEDDLCTFSSNQVRT